MLRRGRVPNIMNFAGYRYCDFALKLPIHLIGTYAGGFLRIPLLYLTEGLVNGLYEVIFKEPGSGKKRILVKTDRCSRNSNRLMIIFLMDTRPRLRFPALNSKVLLAAKEVAVWAAGIKSIPSSESVSPQIVNLRTR